MNFLLWLWCDNNVCICLNGVKIVFIVLVSIVVRVFVVIEVILVKFLERFF